MRSNSRPGWWDLGGRLDRAFASEELAPRFALTDHDVPGRAADAVTESEFLAIVALFSDIRLDRTALEIAAQDEEPEALAFRATTLEAIAVALTTASGRALIGGLAAPEDDSPTRRLRVQPVEGGVVVELQAHRPTRRVHVEAAAAVPEDVLLLHALTCALWVA